MVMVNLILLATFTNVVVVYNIMFLFVDIVCSKTLNAFDIFTKIRY